ncbi:SDR family oxidoreductase [Oceanospirillum beijerinckii]|uniref:SDR family oxidoreductase n=1 Tax=Oceanospirillum beijerinckii TaxID=64976 RepID=UPI00040D8A0F|nr:SDR family oxidoreductase [Oceanospirillum beijerinckii]
MTSKYEAISIGDSKEISHTIKKEDIERFVELSGDDNRLHIDREFASRTPFKKPVVHGMLGVSFISTIIGTKIPGDGALWYSQSLEFLLPVRVGDRLTITATVIKKNDRQRSIELKTDIFNQDKQKVTTGVAKVKIIEEETEPLEEPVELEKVALVAGATGGVGTETARVLASEGYTLILHYHSNKDKVDSIKTELEAEYQGIKIVIVKADLTCKEDVTEMFFQIKRRFSYLTAVVNASVAKFGNVKFRELSWADIEKQLDANIKLSFYLVKESIPMMSDHGYGKIVFITTQAIEQYNSEWLHYITAKSALDGFAKSLAVELSPVGIRVNCVSPSMIDTDLTANIPERTKLVTISNTPLKRLARTSDVAHAVSYLISEKSDFITGETIRVNGGQVML